MKKSNYVSNSFAYLALASGTIWFGGYVARLLVTFQLFEPADFSLKTFITNSNFPAIIQAIHPLINLTFFTYLVFVVFFSLYLISTRLKFKQNGWLFIITMIVYVTLPFEVVLMLIDYKLIILFLESNFSSGEILQLITKRITTLNSFPIILLLSYLAIPYFLVFKPFTLSSKNEN